MKVECQDRFDEIYRVAGIDVSVNDSAGLVRAAVVVITFPQLEEIEVARQERPLEMPYIPGLLSFREAPAILQAFEKLKNKPDLLIVDGQGIAHPRRLGIASHLGVLLDKPSIGCAKSILRGKHDPLPDKVGARAEMRDHNEVVGMAIKTRLHANPIYISIGNRITLESAVNFVEACHKRSYRLPEPTRLAHIHAGEHITC